jgi:hypothetical protein
MRILIDDFATDIAYVGCMPPHALQDISLEQPRHPRVEFRFCFTAEFWKSACSVHQRLLHDVRLVLARLTKLRQTH